MELFLLHFADGNCYSYDFLKNRFGNEVDVYALELPGRGKRYKEKILLYKEVAVHDYVGQLQKLRDDSPYIIYGHSMGATLGFLVANQMEKREILQLD